MKKLSLLLISMMSTFFLTAQTPGTLYQYFGNDGIVLTDFDSNGDDDNASQVAVMQDDFKIILGGNTYMNGTSNLMIARYNPHGSPDMSFGSNGIKVFPFGGSDDYLTDIALQPDGKIVAVGYTTGDETSMLAMRLNADGTFDTGFSGNGMAVIDYGDSINSWAKSLSILEDGRILISGFIQDYPLSYVKTAMCMLTSTGGRDFSFGEAGLLTHELPDTWCYPDEMIVHNEKIILGGVYMNTDFERYATVSRYNLDGSLDMSYGDSGYSAFQLLGDAAISGDANIGMCLAPDGKIVFACNVYPVWLQSDFALLKFNADGGIDNSFGIGGIVIQSMGEESYARDVIVQADGKIIACGSYRNPDYDQDDFMIARYYASGDLDPSFGDYGNGIVISNLSPENWFSNAGNCAIFCNLDRLIVSGYARTDHGDPDFAMACYNTGLSVDVADPEMETTNLQIYPNPVQDQVRIRFELEQESEVKVEVINMNGQKVVSIPDEHFPSGQHLLEWNSKDLPDGIYLIRMMIGENLYTSKVVKSQ